MCPKFKDGWGTPWSKLHPSGEGSSDVEKPGPMDCSFVADTSTLLPQATVMVMLEDKELPSYD